MVGPSSSPPDLPGSVKICRLSCSSPKLTQPTILKKGRNEKQRNTKAKLQNAKHKTRRNCLASDPGRGDLVHGHASDHDKNNALDWDCVCYLNSESQWNNMYFTSLSEAVLGTLFQIEDFWCLQSKHVSRALAINHRKQNSPSKTRTHPNTKA